MIKGKHTKGKEVRRNKAVKPEILRGREAGKNKFCEVAKEKSVRLGKTKSFLRVVQKSKETGVHTPSKLRM